LEKVCSKLWRLCGKTAHNSKRCMNDPSKFHCYCYYIFWEKWRLYFCTAPRILSCFWFLSEIKGTLYV
jgi:hypothetical protein